MLCMLVGTAAVAAVIAACPAQPAGAIIPMSAAASAAYPDLFADMLMPGMPPGNKNGTGAALPLGTTGLGAAGTVSAGGGQPGAGYSGGAAPPAGGVAAGLYKSSILLDPPASDTRIGDRLAFTGTLDMAGHAEGAVVYVKNAGMPSATTGDGDGDLLASAYVDRHGRFLATWVVTDTGSGLGADIYAVFEGDLHNSRASTGLHHVWIAGHVPRPADGGPHPDDLTRTYTEVYWTRDLRHDPHVAVVLHPDEEDAVAGYVPAVLAGLRTWPEHMGEQRGGDWGVTHEVVGPGDRFSVRPDVIINLVTENGRGSGCQDWWGIAHVDKHAPQKTADTVVCTSSHGLPLPDQDVSGTVAHEFIHAMGVGHTFGLVSDMMCGREGGVDTCPGIDRGPDTPSDLNVGAVVASYGDDGFAPPNNHIEYMQRFYADPRHGDADRVRPRQPPSPECDRTDYRHDWRIGSSTIGSRDWLEWTLCSDVPVSYGFSTGDVRDVFMVFVLAPNTDVGAFLAGYDGGGYYSCEAYKRERHAVTGWCDAAPGSTLVVYNDGDSPIRVRGWVNNDAGRP